MKTIWKKLAAALTAGATLLSAALLAGCSGTEIDDPNRFDENVDSGKTQLYVGYYNGGAGLAWLKEVKRLFEEKHQDYQIMIDTGKDEYLSEALRSNIKTNRQDLYIGAAINYNDFVKDGTLMDLSEAVSTPLSEYGESKSILDKMNASLAEYYTTTDGRIFAVPYDQSYHHLIFDADLFDEYNLWYKDGGGFVESAEDKKSAGQDGKFGTWDDGLPVTYSDFFKLCDRMVARGITPLTWSGQYADSYLPNFIASVIADYEGADFATNFDYDGQTTIISDTAFTESAANTFVLDTARTETVTVTPDNFSEYMYRTAGKYYAVKFAKDLVSNPAYRSYNYAESHTGVQRSFLMSNMEGVNKPIAMLVEGNWWINESESVFAEMAAVDEKYALENRRFGVMPIPKADDGSSADGHTIAPYSGSWTVCISNQSEKKDIAVEFFRFLHTDECLKVFTEYSHCFRPYDCDMSELAGKLPYYTRMLLEAQADSEFIFKVPNGVYKSSSDADIFMQYLGFMGSQVGSAETYNMMSFFCDNAGVSAKEYFEGMQTTFTRSLPDSMK